jgi:hypothetical protein
LLTQTRAATWDLYEHYEESLGYADAYREMRRLFTQVRVLANLARAGKSASAGSSLTSSLREIEVLIQIVQVQTAEWTRDAGAPAGPELQQQLTDVSETLRDVMAEFQVSPQILSAVNEEPATVIKSRQ